MTREFLSECRALFERTKSEISSWAFHKPDEDVWWLEPDHLDDVSALVTDIDRFLDTLRTEEIKLK